jgi:hypothetical protein
VHSRREIAIGCLMFESENHWAWLFVVYIVMSGKSQDEPGHDGTRRRFANFRATEGCSGRHCEEQSDEAIQLYRDSGSLRFRSR